MNSDLSPALEKIASSALDLDDEPLRIENVCQECASISTTLDANIFALISEYTADLLCVQAADGKCLYVSRNSTQLFGWHPEMLLGRSLFDFVHPDDAPKINLSFTSNTEELNKEEFERRVKFRIRCTSNQYRWVESRSRPSADARYIISITRDIQGEVELLEKLGHEAHSDSLTGLKNRRALELALNTEVEHSRRRSRKLSAVFVDCDRFKLINDSQGHTKGDEVLRCIGRCIAEAKRMYDIAGRWGGDEFLLLLLETSAQEAALVVNRIRHKLAATMPEVTLSFGISSTEYANSPEQLLINADIALYEAKRLGGNNVIHWSSPMAR